MLKKRNIQNILALMVASIFFFQNCATIISRTSKKIPVTSHPIGARIIVDGKERGYTPLTLYLKKNKSHIVRVETPGYNPLEVRINRKVSSSLALSILGNIPFSGFPCAIIAAAFASPYVLFPLVGWFFMTEEQMEKANRLAGIGFIFGVGFGLLVDILSGANFALSPTELDVTLTKIEGKPQPDIIVIDSERVQNIKWIRIKLSDSDRKD